MTTFDEENLLQMPGHQPDWQEDDDWLVEGAPRQRRSRSKAKRKKRKPYCQVSCNACKKCHAKCDHAWNEPCSRCVRKGIECVKIPGKQQQALILREQKEAQKKRKRENPMVDEQISHKRQRRNSPSPSEMDQQMTEAPEFNARSTELNSKQSETPELQWNQTSDFDPINQSSNADFNLEVGLMEEFDFGTPTFTGGNSFDALDQPIESSGFFNGFNDLSPSLNDNTDSMFERKVVPQQPQFSPEQAAAVLQTQYLQIQNLTKTVGMLRSFIVQLVGEAALRKYEEQNADSLNTDIKHMMITAH